MTAWRFGAIDYVAAAMGGSGPSLKDAPVQAVWDGELAAAMLHEGRAVEEESVLELLLHDLAGG